VFPVGDIDGAAAAVARIVELDEDSFRALSARLRAAFEARHEGAGHQFRAVIQ
jgi:hypothetical protein